MSAELLAVVTSSGALDDIGRGFREAFFMLWDTLWALVLGFTVSGAVQAFVSREAMRRRLGDHRPGSVARASFYGMVSSSCSYAASSMARSLFVRGADYLAAMVFMVASTNLVVELGIVLAVLIGWQFVAAEAVGGVIMIALLVALGGHWLRGRVVTEARLVAEAAEAARAAGGDAGAIDAPAREGAARRFRSAAGWADAAAYTVSELTMLRRELLIGFVGAGFASALVPASVWGDLFLRGHGFLTSVENAVVGPLVALLSCVCSVGNVPLAAALWRGGSSFGGVVAFVFADLIALPLLLVYRRQYGTRLARRMLATFWVVMSAAGLATQYLFRAAGLVPTTHLGGVVVGDVLAWNPTTVADIVALVLAAGLYVLYRNRPRLGGGVGYAIDPVCGMQVDVTTGAVSIEHVGGRVRFCGERCRDRFVGANSGVT